MSQRVVIVEDTLVQLRHYARILEREDYEVHSATSPITAIDIIDQVHPDVILLDFMLTGSNAMVLLHELLSHDDLSQIPIVLVTSAADQLSETVMRQYNVTQILDKTSMLPGDILAALKRAVL